MTRAERECEGPHHREHDDHQSLPVHAGPSDPAYGHHHTYDLAGNRTEVRENGALVANLSYNDANQVIGWSYDAAGNLLSDGTTTRSYDALNRLVAQAGTSYAYNGDGVLVNDGTTTYAQDLAAPLSQVLSDGTANYVYGHGRLRALGGPWYVGDALGSVRTTLDDAGAVLGSVQYDPWGVPTAGTPQPFGFTGELHSTGQVYLRARWYAPGQGRFVSEDPFAGFAEMPYSLHAYQYAYSNPVRWTDPSGLYSSRAEEVMIQVYYDQEMGLGTVYPSPTSPAEYQIYLGSKAGLMFDTDDTLVGDLPENPGIGELDIVDISLTLAVGWAYEIKPQGNVMGEPHSIQNNRSRGATNGPYIAEAEVERYVTIYNALPPGHKTPQEDRLQPRTMNLGVRFPATWQVIGTAPGVPTMALIAKRDRPGVIVWKYERKDRVRVPVFVYEWNPATRTVQRQQSTRPSWPTPQPGQVLAGAIVVGGVITLVVTPWPDDICIPFLLSRAVAGV